MIDDPIVPLEDVGEHVPFSAPAILQPLLVGPDDPILVYPIGEEPLDVRYLDGRRWRLLQSFDFASQTLERIVRVPTGFETDFASIPRVLWPIFPPTGPYGKAALVHDALYRTFGLCSRADADRTLLEAMEALGVNWFTRWTMYTAVRAGGHRSYKGGL